MLYTIISILLLILLIINLLAVAIILNIYLKRIKETDYFFNELIKTIAKLQVKISENELYSKEKWKMNNNKRDVKEQWQKILDKIKKLDNLKMQ